MARGNRKGQIVTFEVPRANVLIALLLALSFVFIYAHYDAPMRTVEIQKALTVVVKEKAQASQDQSGGAGNSSSARSDDEDSNGSNDQDDNDDASSDPDEVYQA